MDLIERYLATVRVLLPKSQRDDIIAELRDVLTGCRDEEAAKLGHPLSQAEEESLLREFGHPILVAGRYRPQQYLIGPDLYPVYSFVLKLVLAIIAGSALLVGIVGTVASIGAPGSAARLALAIAWSGAFSAIGYITLVFAGLQRYSKPLRLLTDWRARDLPLIKDSSRRVTRFSNHIVGIVANAFFIVVWIRLMAVSPVLSAGHNQGLHIAFAPVWHALTVPILAAALCAIAVHAVRLTRKGRGRLGPTLDFALQIFLLIVLSIALQAGHWLLVNGIGVPAQAVANVDRGLNLTLQLSLLVVVCVAVIRAGYDLWQLFRPEQTIPSASN